VSLRVNQTQVGQLTTTGLNSTAIGATTPSTIAGTTGAFTSDTAGTILGVRNPAAGATKYTRFSLGNDSSATIAELYTFSSTYTPSAWEKPSGMGVVSSGSGGLSLVSQSGDVRILAGSLSTVHGLFTSTGLNSTAIGATTPSTGAFTTLSASGGITNTQASTASINNVATGASSTSRYFASAPTTGTGYLLFTDTTLASNRGYVGYTFATDTLDIATAGAVRGTFSSTGLAVTGALSSTGAMKSGTTGTNGHLQLARSSDGATITNFVTDGTNGIINSVIDTIFQGNTTERMRITSAGNVGIGTTSGVTNGGFSFEPNYNGTGISAAFFGHSSAGASSHQYCVFAYNGTSIGSITQNGTTAVLYNVTSDYRRKSNVKDLTGSGAFIDALKPRTFDWDTGDKGVGFIAHEFAEVSPLSVSGEKDSVDADGKPVYQSMQAGTAEVIANLVAELQSLRKRVAALESN
jgi:hypothetical protein